MKRESKGIDGTVRGVTRAEWGLLALVTICAFVARTWRLADMPPGLHVDEAYNLLDAREVIAGWRPVFLPANAGRDVLYTYLQAPIVALFGETALAARLASALVGTAAVPVTWLLARRASLAWGDQTAAGTWRPNPQRVALIAASVMAFTFWSLHFSRYGIRAILFVPIVALTATAWLAVATAAARPTARRSLIAVAVLGVLLAAAAYAHPAGRALVLLPACHAGLIWFRTRNGSPARRLAVAAGVAVVLTAPLVAFWIAHPGLFFGHAGEVSVVGEGPGVVGQNVVRVLAMFHLGGDPAPWRNLAEPPWWLPDSFGFVGQGRPVFALVTGVVMLVGLAAAISAAAIRPHPASPGLSAPAAGRAESGGAGRGVDASVLTLVWLVGLLAPSMLTDAAPNFSRAIGALPFAVLLVALGADRVAAALPPRTGAFALAGWLALVSAFTLRDYFVTYADALETPRAFDAEKVAAGRLVAQLEREGCNVLLYGEMSEHPTIEIAAAHDVRGFDSEGGLIWPAAGTCAAFVFLGADAGTESAPWRRLTDQLEEWTDVSVEAAPPLAGEADPSAVVVRATAPARFVDDVVTESAAPGRVLRQRWGTDGPQFGDVFRLIEAGVTVDGEAGKAQALLVWEVVGGLPPAGLNLFVHFRTADGTNAAQHDGWPLGGFAPSESLRAGERLVSVHLLDLAATGAPLSPSEFSDSWKRSVVVGWYDWRDGVRLAVSAADGGVADDGTAFRVGDLDASPDGGGAR